ncbi:hypothetical protein OAM01_02635 [bacterium]|nr:hypothetical protein [bacterium]
MKGQLADGAGVHRTKGRWPGELTISSHHGASFQSFHGLGWALIDLVLLVLTRGDNSPLEMPFVKTWDHKLMGVVFYVGLDVFRNPKLHHG